MNKKDELFPKNFFTKIKPRVNTCNKDEDISFKWSKSVLQGKSKVTIISNK